MQALAERLAQVARVKTIWDVFAWVDTTADEITPELGDVWENAIDNMRAAVRDAPEEDRKKWLFAHGSWALAFCRMTKERPQFAYYKYIPRWLWPLFNACGPKKEAGNP